VTASITSASELGEPSVTPCVWVMNGAYRTIPTVPSSCVAAQTRAASARAKPAAILRGLVRNHSRANIACCGTSSN
jgi:hypothetical protein